MTTLNESREALLTEFLTEWTTAHPAVPVYLDNEGAKPPESTAWVRLSVIQLSSRQETLAATGLRRFDRGDMVIAQIFAPLNEGTQLSHSLASSVRDILEAKHFSGLRFQAARVRELGQDSQGDWLQTNVEVPFNYTRTK